MAKRHPGETILVQWSIEQRLWRDFLVAKAGETRVPEGGPYGTFTPPEPFPATGIEVAIRDDAIFVGQTCVKRFLPGTECRGIAVRGSRLEIQRPWDDNVSEVYLLPIPVPALADATRLADEWTATDREAARRRAEEEARPTLSNRTRKWVEAHVISVLLAFYFGLIPLVVWCAHLWHLTFGRDRGGSAPALWEPV